MKTVHHGLRVAVTDAIGNPGMVYGIGAAQAVCYFPAGHRGYARAAAGLKALPGPTVGVLRVESLRRHPDSLSVSGGMLLKSTDTCAVESKSLWVMAAADGSADIAHLTRDGGGLAKFAC